MKVVQIAVVASLLASVAVGQDKAPDHLTLLKREIEIHIHENLAWAWVSLQIRNPQECPLEGVVILESATEAVPFDIRSLRKKPATERTTYVHAPDEGRKLYDKLKDFDPKDLEEGGDYVKVRKFGDPLGKNPKFRDRDFDPILVESRHSDTWRLKFFPVLPGEEQTISVCFAWELPIENGVYRVTVPIPSILDMEVPASARTLLSIAIQSAESVEMQSSSHTLVPVETRLRNKYTASGSGILKDTEFKATFKAPAGVPFDLAREIDWDRDYARSDSGISAAEHAVLALRAIGKLPATRAKESAKIARVAGIAHADSSLLLVERRQTRGTSGRDDSAKAPPPPPPAPAKEPEKKIGLDDLRRCDLARAILGLRGVANNPRCDEIISTTSDAERIQWAKDNGLEVKAAPGTLNSWNFLYCRHSKDCPFKEPNPKRFREYVKKVSDEK